MANQDELLSINLPEEPVQIASPVNATVTDDYGATTSTAGSVSVDGSATGEIEEGIDTDWFAVELVRDSEYTIDIEGSPTGKGTLTDTVLRGVYNRNGIEINNTFDDDSGTGSNSQLVFTAGYNGLYYIAAGNFSAAYTGTYTVSVTNNGAPDLPDLTVDNVSVSQTTLQAGDTTTVTFDVSNIGTGVAANTTSGIYLSTNSIITGSDTLLRTEISTGSGPAGSVDMESVTVTLPAGLAIGTYYIGVISDYDDTLAESREDNNDSDYNEAAIAITIVEEPVDTGVTLRDGTGAVVQTFSTITAAIAAGVDGFTIDVDPATYTGSNETVSTGLENITLALPSGFGRTTVELTESGNTTFTSTGDGAVDLLGNTENNILKASGGADSLNGRAGADSLEGGSGNDTLEGMDGNDSLYGQGDDDSLLGGLGDDLLVGGAGNDTQDGMDGNDTLQGEDGADNLRGESGNDVLSGGANNDVLNGGDGEDLLFGGSEDDLLFGGAGFDQIYGGAGFDQIFGGADNDIANGGADNDIINTGGGNDLVFAQSGNDLVFAQNGNDKIFAGTGNDKVFAGTGNDEINLGDGNDEVFAGAGSDLIIGAGGNDVMSGGGSNDTFVFAANQGNDTITDYSSADRLDISAFGVTDGVGSDQDWRDATTSVAASGGGNDVTITWDGGGTLTLEMVGIASLTDSNFVF